MGQIFRLHRGSGAPRVGPASSEGRVYAAIAGCRTKEMGGHLERCSTCGYEHPVYNSCRSRHCPQCQSWAQRAWVDARIERVLPVPHFHVVFTLPAELRALARTNKRLVFDVLFRAAAETLQTLGRQRHNATLGITAVLHTWTRTLAWHPHVHCIVTGGGLALDGQRWVSARQNHLFPVAVVRALFRGKVLAFLRERADDLRGYDAVDTRSLRKQDWVVYLQRPFGGAEAIFAYLGRYTHRVGISNQRLVGLRDGQVVFRTRGDQRACQPIPVFVARFLDHVLPDGYRKVRHYGLLAPANVRSKLAKAERLLRKGARAPTPPVADTRPIAPACPRCGARTLVQVPLARMCDPPAHAAASAA